MIDTMNGGFRIMFVIQRLWRIAFGPPLIVGWLLVTSIALGQQAPSLDEPSKSGNSRQAITDVDPLRSAVDGDPNIRTPVASDDAEKRKDDRDAAALVAQQDAAYWAKVSALVAGAALAVSGITIGLVWSTFRETRRTADAGVQAADAAAKSATAAQKSLQRDRAWLCIAPAMYGDMTNSKLDEIPVKEGFYAQVAWQNYGSTPALHVDIYSQHKLVPRGSDVPIFNRGEVSAADPARRAMVGPGVKVYGPRRILKDSEASAFRKGEMDFYVYSHVRYRDIYEEKDRISEVCYLIALDGRQERTGGQFTISLNPTGPQNRGD